LSRPSWSVVLSAVFALAVLLASTSSARADVHVDTAYQSWGIAPRLEFELGPQFAWALGHACRDVPVEEGDPGSDCTSGFTLLGGQAVALVRPFAHWALGAMYAYDAVLGAHDVVIDPKGESKAAYSRNVSRLSVQLRWYSRSVSTSGFYFAAHAGAAWWTDKVKPITDDPVTQLAPQFGLEMGGVFAPHRGLGVTMGFQSWVAWLRNSPQRTTADYGSTYGYGPFVFVGVHVRLQLGISL
jgi:hypothetical protein